MTRRWRSTRTLAYSATGWNTAQTVSGTADTTSYPATLTATNVTVTDNDTLGLVVGAADLTTNGVDGGSTAMYGGEASRRVLSRNAGVSPASSWGGPPTRMRARRPRSQDALPLKSGCIGVLHKGRLLEYICRKINRQSAYRCFIRAAPGCGDVVSGGCRSSPCDNGPLMGFDPAAGTLHAPLSRGVRRRLPFEAVRTLHPSAGSRHRALNEPRGEAGKGLEPVEGSKGRKVWVRAKVRWKVEARTSPPERFRIETRPGGHRA